MHIDKVKWEDIIDFRISGKIHINGIFRGRHVQENNRSYFAVRIFRRQSSMDQIGREKETERVLYYGFAVIQPKSRRCSFRRSEVNQWAVVIEVAISRANVTHERDLGKNLPFLCAQSGHILLCISHHAALWSARSFVPLFVRVPLLRALFLEKRLFLQSRCSASWFFSFLTRCFLVFLHPFVFSTSVSPLALSISPLYQFIFLSSESSGPRNEQRKSIGWHCGFVSSTVVLDLRIGTMYGICSIKLKSLLCSDVFLYLYLDTPLYLWTLSKLPCQLL